MLWVKYLGKFVVDPEYPIRITLDQHVLEIRIKVYNPSLMNVHQELVEFASSFLCIVRDVKNVHIRNIFHQDTIWASLGIVTLRESFVIEFLELRLPALCLGVNILNHPIEVRHRSSFTKASGLQSTICAALIFEKVDGAERWVPPPPSIRSELPDLLERSQVHCDLFTYHFEHTVLVLPAGSAQKGPISLFDDLNEFHIINVNIRCIIV